MKPLRIAMIGQRGVPATYGGVEVHVEELGARLADRGHEVTVYCRPQYSDEALREVGTTYRGMRLRHVPTVNSKHAEAIVHSALSSVAAIAGRFDVIHYHALGPGLCAALPRAIGKAKVVQTIHGLDNQRAKWGGAAQRILSFAEWVSARVPDRTITVSEALAEHYAMSHQRVAHYIPNGVVPPASGREEIVRKEFGVEPGSYALFLGRLVPEKAPDLLVEAFRRVADPEARLIIAGGSSHTDEFTRRLREAAAADHRVILPGYVYGEARDALYSNAGVFVLPSYLEGLPLTLLEAIAAGVPVLASDIAPHVEVLQKSQPGGRIFPTGDAERLGEAIAKALVDPLAERGAAEPLQSRIVSTYSWDAVTTSIERLYIDVVESTNRNS